MSHLVPGQGDLRDAARTRASQLVTASRVAAHVGHGTPEFAHRLREAERHELDEWLAAEDRAASGRALGFAILLTVLGVGLAWASGLWMPLE
jgi:hypothetical protein